MVIARATQSVLGFCDALLVSPLGGDALAATTTGALNSFALIIFPMGIVFIVQSFAAQLKGRGDVVSARRYAWYGLAIAVAAGVLALASIPFVDDLLGLFTFTPAVRDLQARYIGIRLLSIFGVVGTEALGNWFGGIGNTRLQMHAGLLTMILNVPLAWILIGGHLGAPALGVPGAAVATVIASYAGFAYMAVAFARSPEGKTAGPLQLRAAELGRVLRFGTPNGLNWFLEFAAFSWFIDSVMAHLGTIPLAALNVVFQINSVSFMPAFGVASAGAILVGQSVGAGARDEVPSLLKLTAKVCASWMGAIGLSYLIVPRTLFSIFTPAGTPDAPALLATGATALMLSTSWQVFDAFAITLGESLRATGDTAWCLRARLVLAWCVFVPTSWLSVVVYGGGLIAAILCLVGYMMLLCAALYWRFRSGAWRRIELVEPELV